MSGKIIVAVVAAAVSSASAATVGVVYKKMVEPKPIEISAPVSEAAASLGPVRSAVVLNATDSLFGFLAGSTGEGDSSADTTGGSDATACRGGARCVIVARTSDRRVNILGSAAPSFWLGGNSRDFYANPDAEGLLWFEERARVVAGITHRRPKTENLGLEPQSDQGSAQNGNGDPSGSNGENDSGASDLAQSSPTKSTAGLGYPIGIEVQTSLPGGLSFNDGGLSLVNLLSALAPIDATPNPTPSVLPPTFGSCLTRPTIRLRRRQ